MQNLNPMQSRVAIDNIQSQNCEKLPGVENSQKKNCVN